MKKIILNCYVVLDGIGDFQHLLDIIVFLKSKDTQSEYEYIPTVSCDRESLVPVLKDRLEKAGVNRFYISSAFDFKEIFSDDKSLRQDLSEAVQFIRVSSDFHNPFHEFINPQAVIKFIGEHERNAVSQEHSSFSLGLSDTTYGIKLEDLPEINPSEAFKIFSENDAVFSEHLLSSTQSKDASDLFSHHILIPAYFNKLIPFYRMLLLLVVNATWPDKNIIVNASGRAVKDLNDQIKSFFGEAFLQDSRIKEIKIVNQSPSTTTVRSVNPEGSQTIYIFNGYKISDKSYRAMYQQAKFAGASGDNTFELAISAKALPYYHSTNYSSKKKTLKSLNNIISAKMALPEKVKQDFLTYFENLPDWCELSAYYADEKKEVALISEKFKALDLSKMIEAWPAISRFLIQHFNFYNNLESIIAGNKVQNNAEVFKNLAASAFPSTTASPISSKHSLFVMEEKKEEGSPSPPPISPTK